MESLRIAGQFHSPLIGILTTPAGLVGQGYLELAADGLHVSAHKNPTNLMSILGCLGALIAIVVSGSLIALTGLAPSRFGGLVGVGLLLGGALGGAWLARKIGKPRRIECLLPFAKIDSVALTGTSLEFKSRLPPKGMVVFRCEPSDLASLRELAQRLAVRPR